MRNGRWAGGVYGIGSAIAYGFGVPWLGAALAGCAALLVVSAGRFKAA